MERMARLLSPYATCKCEPAIPLSELHRVPPHADRLTRRIYSATVASSEIAVLKFWLDHKRALRRGPKICIWR